MTRPLRGLNSLPKRIREEVRRNSRLRRWFFTFPARENWLLEATDCRSNLDPPPPPVRLQPQQSAQINLNQKRTQVHHCNLRNVLVLSASLYWMAELGKAQSIIMRLARLLNTQIRDCRLSFKLLSCSHGTACIISVPGGFEMFSSILLQKGKKPGMRV